MTISGASLGLPTGVAGWRLLQTKTPTDFTGFSKDPTLKNDIAYLRDKLPTKLTAKAMLADYRLQKIVLSAYGLDAQLGMNALMEKVLNSDTTDKTSVARRMTNAVYTQIASDFSYGSASEAAVAAVPASAKIAINDLRPGRTFGSISGTFAGVTLQDIDTSNATNRAELAATLQAALRKADGRRSDISVTVFGTSLVFNDAKGRAAAENFSFSSTQGATATLLTGGGSLPSGTPSRFSTAKVSVAGLQAGQAIGNFSGTFGGVALTAIDTSSATSSMQLAATLQAAFRKADGGRTDISVTVSGRSLVFSDTKSRGGAKEFSFDTPDGVTARLMETTGDDGLLRAVTLPEPSTAKVTIEGLGPYQTITSFSGTFGGVTLKSVATNGAIDPKQLAATLQTAFRTADGGRADISVTAHGYSLIFTDSQGSGAAKDFTFDAPSGVTAKVASTTAEAGTAEDSSATLKVTGLEAGQTINRITGTFAGLTIEDVNTSTATTPEALAEVLQTAFRKADGDHTDISVTAEGSNLVFKDAQERGGAASFSFSSLRGPSATLLSTAAGVPAKAATGGPQVTSTDFVDQLAKRYTQAKFEESVGDVSDSLRKALYAKTKLPKITNWYSVIADRNLAAVVQTVLHLPDSFGRVDVDQQASILKSRMNIADFKDPVKLGKLLDRYVAQASMTETSAVNDRSGVLQLVQPIDLSNSTDSFSGASLSALFAAL